MADKKEQANQTKCQQHGIVDRDNAGKTCCSCNEWRSFSEYHKNMSKGDGRESHCKYCVSKRKTANYKKTKIRTRSIEVSNQFDVLVVGDPSSSSIDKFSQIFSTSLRDLIEDGSL